MFSSVFDLTIYLTIVVRHKNPLYNKRLIKGDVFCFVRYEHTGDCVLLVHVPDDALRANYLLSKIFTKKTPDKKTCWLKFCWSFINSMDVQQYLHSSSWRFCNCVADFEQLRADQLLNEFLTCLFEPSKPFEDVPMRYSFICIKIVNQLIRF